MRLVVDFFRVPILHLGELLRLTVQFGETGKDSAQGDETSLLAFCLRTVRIITALGLVLVGSTGVYKSCALLEPEARYVAQLEQINQEIDRTETRLAELKKSAKAWSKKHPQSDTPPPELTAAKKTFEAAKNQLTAASEARAKQVEFYESAQEAVRNDEQLGRGYYFRSRVVRMVDRSTGETQETRAKIKQELESLCQRAMNDDFARCASLEMLHAAWTELWRTIVDKKAAKSKSEGAENALNELATKYAEIEAKHQDFAANIVAAEDRLKSLDVSYDEVNAQASYQWGRAIGGLFTSLIGFIIAIWVFGLATEIFLLSIRWIHDIRAIRQRLDPPEES